MGIVTQMPDSHTIIERFRTSYGKDIDLTLRPAYHDLLEKLGNPQNRLPPVFHVAGTNGKGSTCAFLRSMLEAAGYKAHVYTSPHLVTFHERIRIAGKLISEEELTSLLLKAEKLAIPHGVSYFEAATAVALDAFAQHDADFTILETGLGGRLDATNVIAKPLATIITRLSYDHREYLGETISAIAHEKAGIMRAAVPCFAASQREPDALEALRQAATAIHAPLYLEGNDWKVDEHPDGSFRFTDATRTLDLPRPSLLGQHQYQNASLAIAALSVLKKPLPIDCFAQGLRTTEWPARLQRLIGGALDALVPEAEVWLDGGHNDSAGEVLATQIERWRQEDGPTPRPLYIILGMLTTKRPAEFLSPFAKHIARLCTVPVPHEPLSFMPEFLATEIRPLGIPNIAPAQNVADALRSLSKHPTTPPPRILICGSLYLAGNVLSEQNP